MHESGRTWTDIAQELGVSKQNLQARVKTLRDKQR
jgi:DNA-binding Lrp family transcriptional regulator